MSNADVIVERILTSYDTITVVGASDHPAKAAHSVPAYMQRHGWRIAGSVSARPPECQIGWPSSE